MVILRPKIHDNILFLHPDEQNHLFLWPYFPGAMNIFPGAGKWKSYKCAQRYTHIILRFKTLENSCTLV